MRFFVKADSTINIVFVPFRFFDPAYFSWHFVVK